MSPADVIQLIGVGAVATAVLIPIVGVTARLTLGPLLKARRPASGPPPEIGRVEERMDALEEEVRHLAEAMERVAAAAEFDAQLRSPDTPTPARLPDATA